VLHDKFGSNVHLIFFEEFRDNQNIFLQRLAKALGVSNPVPSEANISNKGYTPSVIDGLISLVEKLKKFGLGFVVPRPIFFFGTDSIYIVEREKYKSILGQLVKKLIFPIRRGRWLRYIARRKNDSNKQAGSFDSDLVSHISDELNQEKTALFELLDNCKRLTIPDSYKIR
jgi:hypothetical protein